MTKTMVYLNRVLVVCLRISIISSKKLKRLGHLILKIELMTVLWIIPIKKINPKMIKPISAEVLHQHKNKISTLQPSQNTLKQTNLDNKTSQKVPSQISLNQSKLKDHWEMIHLLKSSRWRSMHSFHLNWWGSSSHGKFPGTGKGGRMVASPPSGLLLSFLRMKKLMARRYSGEPRASRITSCRSKIVRLPIETWTVKIRCLMLVALGKLRKKRRSLLQVVVEQLNLNNNLYHKLPLLCRTLKTNCRSHHLREAVRNNTKVEKRGPRGSCLL